MQRIVEVIRTQSTTVRALVGAALTVALVMLGACAGGGDTAQTSAIQDETAAADGGTGRTAVGDGQGEAPRPPKQGGQSDEAGGAVTGASLAQIAAARQVIRNADIELTVDETDAAVTRIRQLAERYSGFVANSELSRPASEQQLQGTVVIRVAADQLDAVLDELESLATEVVSRNISTRDVTEEFVDLEARLNNLRALEAELQELLAEVRENGETNPDQLFSVFDRLRQIRTQIDQAQGRLNNLSDQVSLSTVTVHLRPDIDPIAAANQQPWQPGKILGEATGTLLGALRGLFSLGVTLAVVVVPIGAIVLTPIAIGWLVWRRRVTAASG